MSGVWGSIEPARQRLLGDEVYEALARLIRSGELRPGLKLPSEQELTRRFQVSRPVVRRALERMRDEGLVVSRKGSGSFVALEDGSERGIAASTQLRITLHALEYRKQIEPAAARYAAIRRSEGDMEALSQALEAFRMSGATSRPAQVDFLFHRAVATASRNDHFVRALDVIGYDIDLGITLAEYLSQIGREERHRAIFAEHKAIHDAIRDQDPDAAAEAMMRHLMYSEARVIARGEAAGGTIHLDGT